MKQLFPLNSSSHSMNKRKKVKYKVNHARSERYKRSPVIYMQNLLNQNFVNDEICAEDAHNHHEFPLNKNKHFEPVLVCCGYFLTVR